MISGLIRTILKTAFLLAAAGQLGEATLAMQGKAFRASRGGIISLKRLNGVLHGAPLPR